MKLSQKNGPSFNFYSTHAETISHLNKCGFRHVDISFFTKFMKGSIYFSDDYMKVVNEYKEAFKKFDITPVQCHEPAGNNIGDDNGQYYHKKAVRAIEMAAKIGCPCMTIHPGKKHTPMTIDEFVTGNIESIRKMIPLIEEYGLMLLFENIESYENNYFATTADDVIAVIDGIGHPLIQACWDVGHAHINGLNQYDEITKLGNRLKSLHIHDNLGLINQKGVNTLALSDMHTIPFFGNINFDDIMKGLIDINYTGTFNFEVSAIKKHMARPDANKNIDKFNPDVQISSDTLLYQIGKHILKSFNCYEY